MRRRVGSYFHVVFTLLVAAFSTFLDQELPFTAISVLPASTADTTEISGKTALQVIFSRPVIKLGSDWSGDGSTNGALPAELTPFTLQACSFKPSFAVPGKLRWATTSIARFDADIEWPTDLCFDLVLSVNLQTFDGLKLPASGKQRWRFTTPAISWYVSFVRSEAASNLTGGVWSSQEDDSEAHECPPDAMVYLSFSSKIDHSTAFQSLRTANSAILPCSGEISSCYDICGEKCITIRPLNLQNGRKYNLVFPVGSSYSAIAGTSDKELTLALSGLLPFSFPFPFEEPPTDWRNIKFKYRRYRLYLRHGLASTDSAVLSSLKEVISIQEKDNRQTLDFQVTRHDKASVQINCSSLLPDKRYIISVASSDQVKDGYDQPLQASRMEFETDTVPSVFLQPQTSLARFYRFSWDWKILEQGKSNTYCDYSGGNGCVREPDTVSAWPVQAGDLVNALAQQYNQNQNFLSSGKQTVTASPAKNSLHELVLNGKDLLLGANSQQGLFAVSFQSSSWMRKMFVSAANFGAALVATSSDALLVWATNYETSLPVQDASVTVYRITNTASSRSVPSDVVEVAKGITDAKGMVTLTAGNNGYWKVPSGSASSSYDVKLVAVVNAGNNQMAVVEEVPVPWQKADDEMRSELITDRRIYKPGETVYVKGYVRKVSGSTYALPPAGTSFTVSVHWKPLSGEAVMTLVTLTTSHGTFSANLVVPSSDDHVTFGDLTISLKTGEKTLSTAQITVADPRPPTVTMSISSVATIVMPGGVATLPVNINASTYSGVGVGRASIELTWKVKRSRRQGFLCTETADFEGFCGFAPDSSQAASLPPGRWRPPSSSNEEDATGQLNVETSESGVADVTLDFDTLLQDAGKDGKQAPPCAEGDQVLVTARWVGPTREVVHAELKEISVARSTEKIVVTPAQPVDTSGNLPLPGLQFPVYVEVRDIITDSLISGRSVTLSLHEWDGATNIRTAPSKEAATASGLLPVSSWGSQIGQDCVVQTSPSGSGVCGNILKFPAYKKYVVLARASDANNVELVTAFAVGKTPEMWMKNPLPGLEDTVVVRLDRTTYALGDTAKLSFVSPFANARALVLWGNGADRKSKEVTLTTTRGENTIDLKIDTECVLGCDATMILVAPSQRLNDVLPVAEPSYVSPLLDVTLPRSIVKTVRLKVPDIGRSFPDGALQVNIVKGNGQTLGVEEALSPGSAATVNVAALADTEVCVFVVDKAMLDVGGSAKPHDAVDLSKRFLLSDTESNYHVKDTRQDLASYAGYEATVVTSLRRNSLDPWVAPQSWRLHPGTGSWPHEVEEPDDVFMAKQSMRLTKFPPNSYWISRDFDEYGYGYGYGGGGGVPEIAIADEEEGGMPVAAAASRSGDTLSSEKSIGATNDNTPSTSSAFSLASEVHTRSNFQTTPLFEASKIVGADKSVSIPLKLPDNIATFEVRVYAVSSDHRFGHVTSSLISRRSVSMVPSVPRVVRPGDRFDCGVVVTGAENGLPAPGINIVTDIKGDLKNLAMRESASLSDYSNVGASKALSSASGKGPHEVIFPMEALAADQGGGLGAAMLNFKVTSQSSGSALDAMEISLPVKAAQSPVAVSTSVAITAREQASVWQEGLQLPNAMPGSGQLNLTAGVGFLPAVVSNGADILDRQMNNGQVLVAALVPAVCFGLYFTTTAFPLAAAISTHDAAKTQLEAYTNYNLGLMWRKSDAGWSWQRASVSLNVFGILTSRIISQMALTGSGAYFTGGGGVVPEAMVKKWERAMENELKRQHDDSSCTSNCFHWDTIAEVRAAMGYAWNSASTGNELTMATLFSQTSLDNLSPSGLAHAALAYVLWGADLSVESEIDAVFGKLVSLVRIQGATAYIARALGSAHSAGVATNAAVLLSLAWAMPTFGALVNKHFASESGNSLVAKLAAYVAGAEESSSPYIRWHSPRASAMVSLALASYDWKTGSTQPDLVLSATSGSISVLDYEAKGEAPMPAQVSKSWGELQQPPQPLQFRAEGSGQVSVSAALTFVPATVPLSGSIYRGIYVEKIVQLMDPATGSPTGPALQVVNLGASVVVTIQVTTPDDLSRVTLEDLAPGGLEPVDPNVAGDKGGTDAGNECGNSHGYWWSWWCVPSFPYRETYADRIVWTSLATLRAGTHTVSYQAVAATRGVFTLPAAYALVEDQPELMGLSQAGTIVVHDAVITSISSPDPRNSEAVTIFLRDMNVMPNVEVSPVGCPNGCPLMGVCQLTTGKCICSSISGAVDEECFGQQVSTVRISTSTLQTSTTTVIAVTVVEFRMTLENIVYSQLVANQALLANFIMGVKKAIAAAVDGISEEHVSVTVSAGSVIVEARITPPPGISAQLVSAQVKSSSGAALMRENVIAEVADISGIDVATTGNVTVNISQVVTVTPQPETEVPPASKATTSGFGRCFYIGAGFFLPYLLL